MERELSDFTAVRLWSEPAYIVNDLKSGDRARRVIVWDYVPIGGEPALPVGALREGWQVGHDEHIAVRCHWAWSTLYRYRRTEYVRRASQERP